jgi:hypothetical protein
VAALARGGKPETDDAFFCSLTLPFDQPLFVFELAVTVVVVVVGLVVQRSCVAA